MLQGLVAVTLLATLVGCASFQKEKSPAASRSAVLVGAAEVDITPKGPIRLAGYGGRKTESEGVAQRLRAKALALGSDDQGPAVIITADLVGISDEISDKVAKALSQEVGLERSDVAITVTHTHTGPMLSGVLPFMFGKSIPADQQKRIDRYTKRLTQQLQTVALKALENREPSYISWGQGKVGFAVNRRVIADGQWTGFGVTDGPVDHDLPILAVRDQNGTVKAVLLSYACHNTTLTGQFNQMHGDWAGAAQELIEQEYPEAVALIATGAGADANPEPRGNPKAVRQNGRALASEVSRLLESQALTPLVTSPTTRYKQIELPFEDLPTRKQWEKQAREDGVVGHRASKMLDRLDNGEKIPSVLTYPVQTWTFGDRLAMVFLAGEVVVDYSRRLKEEMDAHRLWVNAYSNDVPCYIASARVIKEGGYEVDRSMYYYGQPSRLALSTEELIIDAVHDLTPDPFIANR